MTAVRFGLSIPLAAVITIGLFALMTYMIAISDMPIDEDAEAIKIDFTRVERDETPQQKDRSMPDRPEQIEAPPPPPPSQASASSVDMGDLGMGVPKVNAGVDMEMAGLGAAPEGDVLPLVRVAPQYPQRAMSRGIEGWVQLRFSISQTGTPYNVVVIDADPPNYFDRAASRAVEKWKYKPRVVNGQPVERHGIEVVISFNLED